MKNREPMPSDNQDWGYTGELKRAGDRKLTSWDELSRFLLARYPRLDPIDVRNFLDSRTGRHLADAATFHGDNAIAVFTDPKQARWLDRDAREVRSNRAAFEVS